MAGQSKNPYKIVEVHWLDSEADPDWQTVEELLEYSSLDCRTVGYLIADREDSIVIAGSVGLGRKDNVVHSAITIPKAAISNIKELRRK